MKNWKEVFSPPFLLFFDETATKPDVTEEGLQHAQQMLSKHEIVLQGLIDDPNMSEQYKPTLQRALNNSRTTEDTLDRMIAKMGPEGVPMEERPEEPLAEERPEELPTKGRPRAAPA